ncbi:chymotrypsin-like protease CTRL-1 isoform X3 [Dreissena polymorpha]|nr:chymotrypsin-like protease CTRL-1 isoform X3 [Dreissena polymorpha]XP_052286053.1 chymotrypsin-like protease CTRL-1 isoform X3 [Dreissena polymorpha]
MNGEKCCLPSYLVPRLRPRTTTTTTAAPDMEPILESTCGRGRPLSRIRRVIGGQRSQQGAWPWQVAIRHFTGLYLCGGVVIRHRWVLTAAHCFQGQTDARHLRVYAGDQTLSFERNGRSKTKNIRRIIQHDDFRSNVAENITDPRTGLASLIRRHHHDIALVELEEPLVYNERLSPACLPNPNQVTAPLAPNSCWVYGWGEDNNRQEGPIAHLSEVNGDMLHSNECSRRWGANFTDDVVCFTTGDRGPCKGDSGGGMTCTYGNDVSVLEGIISWGREDCIHDDHPSVMTRVASYIEWINSFINQ